VKKVAEGVAKDIDELNESFHHMLTELDDSNETLPQPLQRSASAEGAFAGGEQREVGEEGESLTPESARREQVLKRLEGEATQLGAGLKVSLFEGLCGVCGIVPHSLQRWNPDQEADSQLCSFLNYSPGFSKGALSLVL